MAVSPRWGSRFWCSLFRCARVGVVATSASGLWACVAGGTPPGTRRYCVRCRLVWHILVHYVN